MKPLHFWIILLTLVSGLAGFAAGELLHSGPVEVSRGRFGPYCDRMVTEFGLSSDHERNLLYLLDRYERELDDLKSRHLSTLEPELVAIGSKYRDLIRDRVLPEGKRRAFDELAAGALPIKGN
jgi:hypothetical protein